MWLYFNLDREFSDLKEHPLTSRPRANFASNMNKIPFIAAIVASLGVVLGAFGAHALRDTLAARGTTSTWETAVFYHLIHASIAWATLLYSSGKKDLLAKAAGCWLAGVFLFSGSLYVLALGGPRWMGPITPIGGLLFIVGWIYAARFAHLRSANDAP